MINTLNCHDSPSLGIWLTTLDKTRSATAITNYFPAITLYHHKAFSMLFLCILFKKERKSKLQQAVLLRCRYKSSGAKILSLHIGVI